MKNNKICGGMQILWHFNRIVLGLVFLFSGFVKAIDPIGTQYKIEDYLHAFGSFFTFFSPLALFVAFMLIAVEFTLGISLLCNAFPKITAWLTLLFYSVMLPLTLYIAVKNPVSDCGCFGDALVLTNWQTFFKNLILISLISINVLIINKIELKSISVVSQLSFLCVAFLGICCFMYWTVKHLPIVDFRPFKIGNNISKLMEYPEDAKPDKYEISFIYEKNGKQQIFDINNYPKNDTSWHFIDQQSKLIEKGYEPPIHDFELLDLNYNNLTDNILESSIPTTLIIMYSLEKSDKTQFQKITYLYQQCLLKNQPCYIVTGASPDQIENFCIIQQKNNSMQNTPFSHPESVFLMCDPITLKTIVRANPGAIIVKNGTIIDKYNFNNK